ncbi:MAG: hypothetical protein ACREOF_15515 [Gemmatimonadales bacterium]
MKLGARRSAVAALAAVFLVGLAGGVVLEEVVDDFDWPTANHANHRDQPDDPMDDDAEEAFFDRLGLRADRRAAIDRALDEREDRLERYWEGKIPELRALVDSSRAEIRLLLTPEQQSAYDRWISGNTGTTIPRQ